MSIVESYGGSENGAGVHNMHGGAGMYMPVMQNSPPQMAAPISAYPGGGGTEGSTVGAAAVGEKRKRGRPRKYPIDGSGSKTVSDSPAAVTANGKRRGRPPGSGNKKSLASVGVPTVGLTPHIITVQAGEDVSSRIMSLSQNGGSQAVCILSANGAISNVTLRQASSSGGTVTYEGRFEILTLSGSYMVLESGGQRSRTGGLSVLLAGSDGRVLGGGVAGLLIAATPVQVVVVGFSVGQEPKSPNQTDYSAGLQKPILGSPTSRGTASESSGSPINHSNGNPNNMGMMQQWK